MFPEVFAVVRKYFVRNVRFQQISLESLIHSNEMNIYFKSDTDIIAPSIGTNGRKHDLNNKMYAKMESNKEVRLYLPLFLYVAMQGK